MVLTRFHRNRQVKKQIAAMKGQLAEKAVAMVKDLQTLDGSNQVGSEAAAAAALQAIDAMHIPPIYRGRMPREPSVRATKRRQFTAMK